MTSYYLVSLAGLRRLEGCCGLWFVVVVVVVVVVVGAVNLSSSFPYVEYASLNTSSSTLKECWIFTVARIAMSKSGGGRT